MSEAIVRNAPMATDLAERNDAPAAPLSPQPPATPPTYDLATQAREAQSTLTEVSHAMEGPSIAQTTQAAQIDPERAAQIDTFVDNNASATSSFVFTYDQDGGEKIGEALNGESALGRMTTAEQRYMSDRAVAVWYADQNTENVRDAANAVRDNPTAARAMATALAMPAADAERYFATGGSYLEATGASTMRAEMADVAVGLDATATVDAFQGVENRLALRAEQMSREDRIALLDTVGSGQVHGEAADRLTTAMFVYADKSDLAVGMAEPMAEALATVRFPGTSPHDATARANLETRLSDVLSTSGGRDLLVNENIQPEMRAWALEKVMTEPSWNADALTSGWESDIVTTAFAEQTADQYAARGTQSEILTGHALRNTVGSALSLTPDNLPADGETIAQRDARLADGLDHQYYTENSHADTVADMIEQVGGEGDFRVSVVPIAVTSNEFGAAAMQVFRVERADGTVGFVDSQGKKYDTLAKWNELNELPPGRQVVPGGLRPGGDLGDPEPTRLVTDSFSEWAGKIGDGVALGVGIVAGVAIVVGTGGTAALIAAGAAGTYTAGRAANEIYDDAQRGVDAFDFSNPQTRSRWLDVAAGGLSVGAIGTGIKVANTARTGAQASTALTRTAAGLAIAGDTADAVAMGDQALQMARNWEDMSNGQRAMGMLNMAFYGGMAAASTRAGGVNPADMYSFQRIENTMRTGTPYEMGTSPDLVAGEMRVTYNVAENGRAENIRIIHGDGPVSRQTLDLHTDAARQIERAGGLRAQLHSMMGGAADAPIGSAAWEAKIEITKITGEAENVAIRLSDPSLHPTERANLVDRQRELDQAITREETRLRNHADDGEGFIAAPRSKEQILTAYENAGYIQRGLPDSVTAPARPTGDEAYTIDYGQLNANGQAEGIEATITQDLLDANIGTEANPDITDLPGWGGRDDKHARGHLLARWLGGSGDDRRNLATVFQNPVNTGVMSSFERNVRDAVLAGETLNYKVTPIYDGDGMPTALAISARGSGGYELDVTLFNRSRAQFEAGN